MPLGSDVVCFPRVGPTHCFDAWGRAMVEPSRHSQFQTNGGRQLLIHAKLGAGTYGTVYEASLKHGASTPDVAVRVAVKLRRGPKTAEGEAALSREYRLVRSCAHPKHRQSLGVV